jgi:hypothetical protein
MRHFVVALKGPGVVIGVPEMSGLDMWNYIDFVDFVDFAEVEQDAYYRYSPCGSVDPDSGQGYLA